MPVSSILQINFWSLSSWVILWRLSSRISFWRDSPVKWCEALQKNQFMRQLCRITCRAEHHNEKVELYENSPGSLLLEVLMRVDCYEIWLLPDWERSKCPAHFHPCDFQWTMTWQIQRTTAIWLNKSWPVHYRQAFWCEEAEDWTSMYCLSPSKSSNSSSSSSNV